MDPGSYAVGAEHDDDWPTRGRARLAELRQVVAVKPTHRTAPAVSAEELAEQAETREVMRSLQDRVLWREA